ncbi:unnamed protein product [Owenia fusiformis]|uniref:Uncharacterized protein n=1 Tax=Owenia fusiformis TaxID=6347 RepID=A0A8J1T5M5_OWEFU|nr:unnamed protein product [Owenia fusiformis]
MAFSRAFGFVNASRFLHNKLVKNILRCPMSFFDTTPMGRVLNRFSKDLDIVDITLPQYIMGWLASVGPMFATIVAISYSTPIFLIALLPLGICFFVFQRLYTNTARQLKRIESVRRSPIFSHFSETLTGVSSIRAYNRSEDFVIKSEKLLDNSQRTWFPVIASYRWIGTYLGLLGNMIILLTGIFAVIEKNTINAGLAGLSLSYAMRITLSLIMWVRNSCELETYIVSVERIKEYCDTENEADWRSERILPIGWPTEGAVEYKEYSTRYRKGLDLVLKGVSFNVKPSEKVGIVGRTGAGKSSLTLSLFRIIEAAGGAIFIDGVKTSELGLHQLRSKLTIIPQDPVLFSGTLRMNVDPSEEYTDRAIWQALEHAHLKDFIRSLTLGLDHECGEEGENLSVGQRQLLCLGRALLRKSKILVLDEATAAVDLETDDLIQNTIRTAFKDCTVLTIAHRLNTIMDYDRVMLLDAGKVVEYDSPSQLLSNKDGIFYSMAKDAGLFYKLINALHTVFGHHGQRQCRKHSKN